MSIEFKQGGINKQNLKAMLDVLNTDRYNMGKNLILSVDLHERLNEYLSRGVGYNQIFLQLMNIKATRLHQWRALYLDSEEINRCINKEAVVLLSSIYEALGADPIDAQDLLEDLEEEDYEYITVFRLISNSVWGENEECTDLLNLVSHVIHTIINPAEPNHQWVKMYENIRCLLDIREETTIYDIDKQLNRLVKMSRKNLDEKNLKILENQLRMWSSIASDITLLILHPEIMKELGRLLSVLRTYTSSDKYIDRDVERILDKFQQIVDLDLSVGGTNVKKYTESPYELSDKATWALHVDIMGFGREKRIDTLTKYFSLLEVLFGYYLVED